MSCIYHRVATSPRGKRPRKPSQRISGLAPRPVGTAKSRERVQQLRGRIVLFTTSNDSESAVRQWPLQCTGLRPACPEPDVDLVGAGQNDGHGFRMDRTDFGIDVGRQERKQVAGDFAFGKLPGAGPACPDTSEERQRPRIVERKSDWLNDSFRRPLVLAK